MQLNVLEKGTAKTTVDVAELVFDREYNEGLIHQVIVAQMAGERQGSKAQKTRAEVSGGGIKPWRQKGTGRARAGSIRSPIWVGGGKSFAAKPRSFKQKVNRKMHRAAMCAMLSEMVRQERLLIVEDIRLTDHKTKGLMAKLNELNVNDVLMVVEHADENLLLASRNLHNVAVIDAQAVDPLALISFEKTVITVAALKQLEERLS
ncbi:MAG: 50S ribosomal protein L4 [Gammaproteobacteria bacterium CG11_big_fil_rev_8_21_14_0_20_46_22]|nr:MAG: 50S ribosomal protein L4 [Gammaproteobacteria bacterium CG12_big_fil_rev_8_21_14_0_65_46_12]PIR11308.1 MAG: 50S ribosomal protein L4 [Gammaproteobacteria bacterium CG11_big_fil_rev_8_21_14_0_20_46_22]